MSNCQNCQTVNDADAKFCKACGSPFKKPTPRSERGFVINEQALAGQAELKALQRSKLMFRLLVIGFGLTTAFLLIIGEGAGLLGGIVAVSLSVFLSNIFGRVRRREYSVLPGAVDARGNHRCVECGRRGIWRRTVYKTNTTIAACSNCQAELWYE